MKKYILPFVVLACLLIANACSTKFNVAAPYKNITVIYAFLDQGDTAHYVRIQKAFLDQNKSALTMATVADSNFYANVTVTIERYDFSGNLHDKITLNKVDLAAEGYTKSPGVFFTAPNYAYKFKGNLDPEYIYRIKVVNPATLSVDSADAPIIENNPVAFNVGQIDDTDLNRAGLDFSNSSINKFYQVYGTYTAPSDFMFEGLSVPVYVAQAILRFNWLDSDLTSHIKTPRSYDYNLGFQVLANGQFDYSINHLDLYTAVNTAMVPAPANVARLIDRCDLFVYASTYDYYLYEQSSLTQGTGLTGNEIEPIQTNIKGKDALGLFTSKAMRSGKLTITINTVDSLMQNPLTQGANIRGTAY